MEKNITHKNSDIKDSWLKNPIKTKEDLNDKIKKSAETIGSDSYWILYCYDKVWIGKGSENLINEMNHSLLKEFRLFSPKGELHLWKYGDEFRWRLRVDDEREDANIHIEEHYIWDRENRGELKNIELESNRHNSIPSVSFPMKYQVYNYFDYDDNGLIKFYDARLVNFVNGEGE